MAKSNLNLEVQLTAKIDQLTAQLNTAQQRINQFSNNSRRRNGSDDIFSGLLKSGLAFGAGMLTINTAMSVFEGVTGSSQTAGDAWEVTINTMKGGLEGFYRTIGTGDWGNLVDNMLRGAAAAKNLTEALDELFEKGNAVTINNAQLDYQIAELEQARNIAKANKDYSKIIEIAENIAVLELKKLNNQLIVAQAEKDAFFGAVRENTQLSDESILNFIRTYNDGKVEEIRKLAIAYNEEVKKIENTKSGYMLNGQYIETSADTNKKMLADLKSKTKEEVVIYAATLKAYNSINEEKIKSAVEAEKKIYEVQAQSIRQQTANEVAMAKARNKEDDFGNKSVKTNEIEVKPVIQPTGLDALKAELQRLLNLQSSQPTIELAVEMNQSIDETRKKIEDWENKLNPKPVEIKVELVGIQALEAELNDLKTKQNQSATAGDYQGYEKQIQAKQQAIRNFRGEIDNTSKAMKTEAEQMQDYLGEVGNAFGQMSAAMAATGNEGAAKFFGMIEGINSLMMAINSLGMIMQQQAAIQAATDAAKLASAPAQVGANAAVAQSEAIRSGAALPPPFNIIAIAAGVAAVIAAFASISKFETGGIVGGNSFIGDNQLVRVNSGEMILNQSQQGNLFKMLNNSKTNNNSGQVEFRISGDSLIGVINNRNKKINSYK